MNELSWFLACSYMVSGKLKVTLGMNMFKYGCDLLGPGALNLLYLNSKLNNEPSKHLLVFKMSSTRLQRNNFSSSKTSWRRLANTSWRHLARRLEDVLEDKKLLRWRRLEDVLKTCLEDVLKTCLEDVLKTCLEDVLKTCLEDVLKTSWRQTKCLLGICI